MRNQAGFTLIELMVVMIILGLLAAIVFPNVMSGPDKARYTSAQAQMSSFETALKLYKLDNGLYPSTEQGLEALVRRPSVGVPPRYWREGGYLGKTEVPLDPWDHPYMYVSPGQYNPEYDLKSLGADGAEGGTGYNADLESWRVHQ